MKKHVTTIAFLLVVITAAAQERRKPPTVEEKIRHTNEFLKKEVGLPAAKQKQVDAIFKDFFTAEDKVRKDNPPPPPPPGVKEAMDKLLQQRDAKLKQVLTAAEFSRFKEKEKQMHPPPPPRAKSNAGGTPPPPQN